MASLKARSVRTSRALVASSSKTTDLGGNAVLLERQFAQHCLAPAVGQADIVSRQGANPTRIGLGVGLA